MRMWNVLKEYGMEEDYYMIRTQDQVQDLAFQFNANINF